MKTPNTVPNNTLQNIKCQYYKKEGHLAKDCQKRAKLLKIDTDHDRTKCFYFIYLGPEEPTFYFGASIENHPFKRKLTKTQQKLLGEFKNSKNTSAVETKNF